MNAFPASPACRADLVQAALIVCGIMTFFQVLGLRIPKTPYQVGAGILSCMVRGAPLRTELFPCFALARALWRPRVLA
jgi:hypothetical protein